MKAKLARLISLLLLLLPIALVMLWPDAGMRAQSPHNITLSWSSYSQGGAGFSVATGIYVYRAAASAAPVKVTAAPLPITAVTYVDSAVVAGTVYTYQLTAVDAAGDESAPSNAVTVTAIGNPVPPSGLTAVPN